MYQHILFVTSNHIYASNKIHVLSIQVAWKEGPENMFMDPQAQGILILCNTYLDCLLHQNPVHNPANTLLQVSVDIHLHHFRCLGLILSYTVFPKNEGGIKLVVT